MRRSQFVTTLIRKEVLTMLTVLFAFQTECKPFQGNPITVSQEFRVQEIDFASIALRK